MGALLRRGHRERPVIERGGPPRAPLREVEEGEMPEEIARHGRVGRGASQSLAVVERGPARVADQMLQQAERPVESGKTVRRLERVRQPLRLLECAARLLPATEEERTVAQLVEEVGGVDGQFRLSATVVL